MFYGTTSLLGLFFFGGGGSRRSVFTGAELATVYSADQQIFVFGWFLLKIFRTVVGKENGPHS